MLYLVLGILEQALVIGAHIQENWQAHAGIDSCCSSVQQNFALCYSHSAAAQIPQPQNPFSISYHHNPAVSCNQKWPTLHCDANVIRYLPRAHALMPLGEACLRKPDILLRPGLHLLQEIAF